MEKKIEEAKRLYQTANDDQKYVLESLFPELKESEDKKIRKALITIYRDIPLYSKVIDDIRAEDIIKWLEKQGEKSQGKTALETWKDMRLEVYQQASGNRHEPNYSDNTTKMFSLNDIDEIMEKISEQKPVVKVEPKFHEGDWVVCEVTGSVYQIKKCIENLSNHKYGYDLTNGGYIGCDEVNHYHLWTIQDAKDGDVLVNGSNIFIFSNLSSTRTMGYCHINLDDGRFYDDKGKNECFGLIDAVFTPATKEQRELLFAKMKEAGYTFDFEKKELKKIEHKITESMDETIRKAIIDCIKGLKYYDSYYGVSPEEMLTWLERQGESDETINSAKFVQGVLKCAAINLITWIDYKVAEGNMCLSNTECKDIIDALANCNWDKIYDYMKKKLEKQEEL